MSGAHDRNQFGEYILKLTKNGLVACYNETSAADDKAFWRSVNPMVTSLPYFVTQLSIMILLIRISFILLNFARQPRFTAEILSSILLGPVFLGRQSKVSAFIHPMKSTRALETMGNLAVVYYMFLMGLEMDIATLRRIGRKAMSTAVAGTVIPFGFGVAAYYTAHRINDPIPKPFFGALYCGIACTVTSFPDLARVLSDIKLLHTDIGRLALSSALISDLVAWAFLVGAVTIPNGAIYYSPLPSLVFILFSWFLLRPALSWAIHNTSSQEGKYSELHIHFILAGVSLCGFITDACGSQSLLGAFMLGLIMPHGELGMRIMEKLEDFVSGILLPAFFLIIGLRINLIDVVYQSDYRLVLAAIVLAFSGKVISAMIISLLYGMPVREGITLGVLTNTKGVFALIIINAGKTALVLDGQSFISLVIAFVVMMIPVKIVPAWTYKLGKQLKRYKHRTMERSELHAELRILVCIHTSRNLSGMINLLEFSNSTKQSPICVFAVHLVELTGRASAMLIIHDTHKTNGQNCRIREGDESAQIISAFESYESRVQLVSVQPLTAVSPYATMHEDVCSLAEDKRVTMLLVPFHKQPSADGMLQEENPSVKIVNQNLLARPPCSIGIFINRGLGSSSVQSKEYSSDHSEPQQPQQHFAMLFTGGPDDREALAYAGRMAGSPNVNLTVVRFLPTKEAANMMADYEKGGDAAEGIGTLSSIEQIEKERQLDDEYVNEFRFKTMGQQSITYIEKVVTSGDEVIAVIRKSFSDYDLYIVGQGKVVISPLTLGISDWSDCEELGALGDVLSTSEFTQHASILVIKQYRAPDTGRLNTTTKGAQDQKPVVAEFDILVNHRRKATDEDDHY